MPPTFPHLPLGVFIDRSDPNDPWQFEFTKGPTTRKQHFRERFKQTATDAALLLRLRPPEATPVAFWLHCLYRHCVENWPEYISSQHTSGGGSLHRICEASAAYCAWRDRRIIEATGGGNPDALTSSVLEAMDEVAQDDPLSNAEDDIVIVQSDIAPLPQIDLSLQELKSFRTALDNQDALLQKDSERSPSYEIPLAQWLAIKGVLEDIIAKVPDCAMRLTFHSEPNVVRAQIGRVRAKIQPMIDVLEREHLQPAPPGLISSIIGKIEEPPYRDVGATKRRRAPSTVFSFTAARKMQDYIDAHGMGQTAFSIEAGTTDRTIRSFRATGKVRKDVFVGIAKAMGISPAELLSEDWKVTGK